MKEDVYSCLGRIRRKPDEEPQMFPGQRLTNKVEKSQFAAQIIGDTFERVALEVLGSNWRRLYPESEFDVRPDLGHENGLDYVESKASKDRRYYKVATEQLNEYKKLIARAEEEGTKLSLVYFLWSYHADGSLSGKKKTIEHVITTATKNVVQLDIIDWRIMCAIRDKEPKNTQYREYKSWRNTSEAGGGYKALQISHPFMRRFRENAHNVLWEELGLEARDYDLRTGWKTMGVSITVDGIEFETNRFKVNRYVSIPKPEIDIECPFLDDASTPALIFVDDGVAPF